MHWSLSVCHAACLASCGEVGGVDLSRVIVENDRDIELKGHTFSVYGVTVKVYMVCVKELVRACML
jgi:hypothetical protein